MSDLEKRWRRFHPQLQLTISSEKPSSDLRELPQKTRLSTFTGKKGHEGEPVLMIQRKTASRIKQGLIYASLKNITGDWYTRRNASFSSQHRVTKEEAFRPFIQSDYQIDVWIDMPIEEAERSFAQWRIATEPHEGGTRLRCGRDRLELFAAMLLSTGRRIVVHQPAELRDTFRQLAGQAMQAAESSPQ